MTHTGDPSKIARLIRYRFIQEGKPQPKVSFLIGAGFSVSAGIPVASTNVSEHLRTHPLLQDAGDPPPDKSEYAYLMGKLLPAERMEIIRSAIAKSKEGEPARTRINWAHLLLATMVDAGFVKYVLTTNFDPLAIDALALMGQPVRVFDLTASDFFMSGVLEPGSVIYLHCQASGLLLANTAQETGRIRGHLGSIFQDIFSDGLLIVIGYSGECDPVLDELDKFHQFSGGLFWVHYSRFGSFSRRPVEQHAKTAKGRI